MIGWMEEVERAAVVVNDAMLHVAVGRCHDHEWCQKRAFVC